jgi:hypothetical protein
MPNRSETTNDLKSYDVDYREEIEKKSVVERQTCYSIVHWSAHMNIRLKQVTYSIFIFQAKRKCVEKDDKNIFSIILSWMTIDKKNIFRDQKQVEYEISDC